MECNYIIITEEMSCQARGEKAPFHKVSDSAVSEIELEPVKNIKGTSIKL